MADKKLLVVALLLIIFTATKISSQGTCEPECSGTKDFDKVVDPRNCTNYYTCVDQKPLPHPIPCPDGEEFDPGTLECKAGSGCEAKCSGGGSGTCMLTCSEDVPGINDPFDCNIYYECGPGGPEPGKHCPDNTPYYNSSSNLCVNDESVCCVPSCEAECVEWPSLIPDPLDCTKYYLCQEEGEPTEDFHFQCDGGQSFDLGIGRCSPDAKCQTLCTGSTTAGGTTAAGGSTAAGGTTISPASGATTGSGGSSVPMTTSAAPVPTGDCVVELMCDAIGNFPKCQSCQPQYFSCTQIGQPGTEKKCSNGYAFNTDPAYPACVLTTNCPYHPHKDPIINFFRN